MVLRTYSRIYDAVNFGLFGMRHELVRIRNVLLGGGVLEKGRKSVHIINGGIIFGFASKRWGFSVQACSFQIDDFDSIRFTDWFQVKYFVNQTISTLCAINQTTVTKMM